MWGKKVNISSSFFLYFQAVLHQWKLGIVSKLLVQRSLKAVYSPEQQTPITGLKHLTFHKGGARKGNTIGLLKALWRFSISYSKILGCENHCAWENYQCKNVRLIDVICLTIRHFFGNIGVVVYKFHQVLDSFCVTCECGLWLSVSVFHQPILFACVTFLSSSERLTVWIITVDSRRDQVSIGPKIKKATLKKLHF